MALGATVATLATSKKWGPLQQAEQLLVAVATPQHKRRLLKKLSGSHAFPSAYLPDDTWLIVGPKALVTAAADAAGAPWVCCRLGEAGSAASAG